MYTANSWIEKVEECEKFLMHVCFSKIWMLDVLLTDLLRLNQKYGLVLSGTESRFIRIGLFILDSLNIMVVTCFECTRLITL